MKTTIPITVGNNVSNKNAYKSLYIFFNHAIWTNPKALPSTVPSDDIKFVFMMNESRKSNDQKSESISYESDSDDSVV